tara:strand:+ start:6824 stop:8134 length:1311 start_codon:yes stop_codon:yes gene_type:complete
MLILFYLLISILVIIVLSTKFKLNPAISLFIGGILLGVLLNIGLKETLSLQVIGLINSFKGIGLIILFSCIIGQILKESNSIKRFGNIILNSFQNKSLFSVNILGLLIGTVVFCDSAFLILNGISRSIASSSSLSLSSLNLSLSGGLYSSHTLIPPTPGPIAMIGNFNMIDQIGSVMTLGILVSIPSSLIAFLFARTLIIKDKSSIQNKIKRFKNPNIFSYLTILIPLLLISLNTISDIITFDNNSYLYNIINYIGNPIIALFIGVVLSLFIPRKKKLNSIIKNSLNDFLPIVLLTSMGAAFGNIIKNSDLTLLLPDLLNINDNNIVYICFIGFICSAILKTSQGSSTSSMIIVSSIIFPIISDFGFDIFELSMIILSIGSGSMMISHVNDSYFWIVTKQTKFNLVDGLKYFSIMSVLQSFGTFLFIVILITLKSL